MKLKKIPYGMSDFKDILTQNYYYIDKTKFIPILEDDSNFVAFLRPRRFGKSLTLAMLEAYYDIYFKDEFDDIFKNTFIYNNQTPLKSSFHTLRFDFSGIDTTDYQNSFRFNLSLAVDSFCDRYKLDYIKEDNPINKIKKLLEKCKILDKKIYILIDEYDNFVTKLLTTNIDDYKNIVTTKNAIYKEFFTMLKVGASGNNSPIKKIFITGVSPVALYDVTSGNNITKNLSLKKEYNSLVGITKEELIQMIDYYGLNDKKDMIINTCDSFYNNYRFNDDVDYTIYNSDMILYYFNRLVRSDGNEPRNLIDSNLKTDYSKLKYLIYTNNRLNGNFDALNRLIRGESIDIEQINDNFSAFEMVEQNNFLSFVFSLGFVTLRKSFFKIDLFIPNQTMKKLLSEFIDFGYRSLENRFINTDELNRKLINLAINKDLSAFRYLSEVIDKSTSIRDYVNGEDTIKAFLIAYLNLNIFYKLISEPEVNKGFVDILLDPVKEEVPYGAMIEVKYIKRELKGKAYKKELKQKINKAKEQLQKYDLGKRYIKIILVFYGWELVVCEEYLVGSEK